MAQRRTETGSTVTPLVDVLDAGPDPVGAGTGADAAVDRRRVWQDQAMALATTLQPPFDFTTADRAVAVSALQAAGAVGSTIARLVDGEVHLTASSGRPPEWVGSAEHESAVHSVLDGGAARARAGPEHVVLIAPLTTHLLPPGALAVYLPAGTPVLDAETQLLADYAEQAAMALDRARAFQEREQMTLVSDRDRIARELHDVVIQRLFATGLHLQKSRAMAADPELKERLALSMRDLDETIRAIRGTIFDLRSPPRRSVRSDLREVLDECSEELGFTPGTVTHGPVDEALDPVTQDAFVEVLRQTLTSVARRAAAESATVHVEVTDDCLVARVGDDGRGATVEERRSVLSSLARAVESRGGSLELRPRRGGGTVVECRLPWRR